MQIIVLAMLAAVTAGLLLLLQRQRRQQALLATLTRDQQSLAAAWSALPVDAAQLLDRSDALITIEILNPVELASQESPLAGPLGRLAPGLIRKRVYQRAAEMLRRQLGEHGVQAEVRIRGLA